MSIYLDPPTPKRATTSWGRGVSRSSGWSALYADTTGELHDAATALGLATGWCQEKDTAREHYDLGPHQRARACRELGAIELTATQVDLLIAAHETGQVFDLAEARRHPAVYRRALADRRGGGVRVQVTDRRHPPTGVVWVGIGSPWANPYMPASRDHAARAAALAHFHAYLDRNPALVERARGELAGQNLGCSCPADAPCHADVWLDLITPVLQ